MGASLSFFCAANDEIAAEVMDRPSDFLPTAVTADADMWPRDLSDGMAQ